jgi:glycosyltransferase involved in cell wall biosynthesis
MEEVGPLMNLATVAVFPDRNSSQSGALQVAYTFSRPVVATKVGGLPDAVEEGRSGLLVAPCAPDELAQAILRLVDNPDLAAEMGAYANHLSQTCFAWNPIAANIIAVYNDLIVPAGKGVKEGV